MIHFYFFLILLSSLFVACNEQQSKIIIKSIEKTYSTKIELGEIVKDSLFSGYELGYYKNGVIKYRVSINHNDTIKYENTKISIKTDSNKIFYYDKNGDLTTVDVQKGDTTFTYLAKDLSTPQQWELFDKNHNIIKAGFFVGKLRFYKDYKNRKFDDYGNLTYAIIIITYDYSDLVVRMIIEKSYEYLD